MQKHHVGWLYEKQQVAHVFSALAKATLRQVAIFDDDIVLDAACGTGIVARHLEKQLNQETVVFGIDSDTRMIEVARSITADRSNRFEWQEGDVLAMPYADEKFSIVICQQGLQFFADKGNALREIRRVLITGGRLALTVWKEENCLVLLLAKSISKHISNRLARGIATPSSKTNPDELYALVENSGFNDVFLETLTVERSFTMESVQNQMKNTSGFRTQDSLKRNEAIFDGLLQDIVMSLEPYRTGSTFTIPQLSYLVQAVRT